MGMSAVVSRLWTSFAVQGIWFHHLGAWARPLLIESLHVMFGELC